MASTDQGSFESADSSQPADSFGSSDPIDIDVAAASLQADHSDVRVLLKVLVDRLSGALGDRLRVERGGGFLRRSPEIRRVIVLLGDDQLEAALSSSGLECRVAHSSGGIRIRSSKVSVDAWLHELLSLLRREAASSETTRLALESIVIGPA